MGNREVETKLRLIARDYFRKKVRNVWNLTDTNYYIVEGNNHSIIGIFNNDTQEWVYKK